MATKSVRYLDAQGRIILPTHIRKSLNLTAGSGVEVDLAEDGTIRLRPEAKRCCICGRKADDSSVTIGEKNRKYVCARCTEIIREEIKEWQ